MGNRSGEVWGLDQGELSLKLMGSRGPINPVVCSGLRTDKSACLRLIPTLRAVLPWCEMRDTLQGRLFAEGDHLPLPH